MERAVIVGGVARREACTAPTWFATYDVVVVGLGTAGAEAFRTLAQDGCNVLGIERANGMGGQGTIGCICFGGSVTRLLAEYERAAERGDVLYETVLTGVWIEGSRIVGLQMLANGRTRDVAARIVIDATGNATVPRMLGLPLRKGRDFDGVMAPCSRGETWLNAKGVQHPIYRNYPIDLTESARAYSDTISFFAGERHKFWRGQRKTERLLRPSILIGAREECRVVTEEVLTLADALAGRTFPNPIFHAWEPEDLPVFYGDHAFESKEIQNWKVLCGLPFFGYPATLTYGTLVAKGVDNLFVPSKHFGVAHDLGGGIRMQGEMRKTGIVAAKAAKIALAKKCAARDVPYAELRPKIAAAGMLKPARKSYVTSYHGYDFKPYTDDDVLVNLRQDITRTGEWWFAKCENAPSERAAFALWTCWNRRLTGTPAQQKALADRLVAELKKDDRYAGNFAVALGLLEDPRAIPALRELVTHPGGPRDPVVKKAYPNRVKAILLLGRFADAASIPSLWAIVQDEARAFTADLVSAQAFPNADMCRFQTLSYALMALKVLLARHPDETLVQALRTWQKRAFTFKASDGKDLADRLQRVEFTHGGPLRSFAFAPLSLNWDIADELN